MTQSPSPTLVHDTGGRTTLEGDGATWEDDEGTKGARARTTHNGCIVGRVSSTSPTSRCTIRLALGVVVAVVVGLIGVDGAQCPAAYNCIYLNAIPEQGYTFEWKATQTIYSLPYGEVRMCCVWCACCTCVAVPKPPGD